MLGLISMLFKSYIKTKTLCDCKCLTAYAKYLSLTFKIICMNVHQIKSLKNNIGEKLKCL
jgi:DNA-binding CsgD family transcriptional regulator